MSSPQNKSYLPKSKRWVFFREFRRIQSFSNFPLGGHGHRGFEEFNYQVSLGMSRRQGNLQKCSRVVTFIVFELQPTPRTHSPSLPGSRFRVVVRLFSSRIWVAARKQLKINSKTTEKQLEIDSSGGGSVAVRGESGGWAVAEKQCHYSREGSREMEVLSGVLLRVGTKNLPCTLKTTLWSTVLSESTAESTVWSIFGNWPGKWEPPDVWRSLLGPLVLGPKSKKVRKKSQGPPAKGA